MSREEKKLREAEEHSHELGRHDVAFQSSLREDQLDVQQSIGSMTGDVIVFTQDFEDEKVDNLIHELKNHIKNSDGAWQSTKVLLGIDEQDQEVWQELPPKLNDMGIMDVVSLARPYFHRGLINSNYDEQMVNFTLKKTKRTLRRQLIVNAPRYGLGVDVSPTQLSSIIDCVMNHIIPQTMRAKEDGERRHLRQFTKQIKTSLESDVKPKKKEWW